MRLDTKIYWLNERQSQCDFDFESVTRGSSALEAVNRGPELVKLKNPHCKKAVARERLVKTQQAEKILSGCCGSLWILENSGGAVITRSVPYLMPPIFNKNYNRYRRHINTVK
jgi:hypothetical protein